MIVTLCDRCHSIVGADSGLTVRITDDTIRGTRGRHRLCGNCASEFAAWLLPEAAPSMTAAEVRAYAKETGGRLTDAEGAPLVPFAHPPRPTVDA